MFGSDVEAAAKNHANMEWPRESVGLVIDGLYHPVVNSADDPTKRFRFESSLLVKHDVQAIIHSHPSGIYEPSMNDQEQQIATAIPWGIVPCAEKGKAGTIFWWGDDENVPPLIGREYRLGPRGSDGKSDCYALVRDYYLTVRGVRLPEIARTLEEYSKQPPWYDTLFEQFGFREIKGCDVKVGDLMLLKIQQAVSNHATIVVEDGMVLHHMARRLSGRSPLVRYKPFVTRFIRYVK